MNCACRSVTGFGLSEIQPVTISYDSGGGTRTFVPIRNINDLYRYNVPGPGIAALTAFFSNTTNPTIRAWLVNSLRQGTGLKLASNVLLSGAPLWNAITTSPPYGGDWRVLMQMIYDGSGKASAAWCNSPAVTQAWVAYKDATSINVWQSIAHVAEAVGLAVGAGYALPAIAGEGAGSSGLAPSVLPGAGASPLPAAPIDLSGLAPVGGGLSTIAPVGTLAGAGAGSGAGILSTVATGTGTVLKTASALQQLKALGSASGSAPGPIPPGAAPQRASGLSSPLALLAAAAGLGLFLIVR